MLRFAIEGRKQVKLELYKIDATYDPVFFRDKDAQSGKAREVIAPEEKRYPHYFRRLTPRRRSRSTEGGTESPSCAELPAGRS